MYYIVRTKRFDKSLKRINKSGYLGDRKEVEKIIDLLKEGNSLPSKIKDHQLKGVYKNYRECHIRGDLLLIYKKEEKELVLILIDIGSHSHLGL
jgi:mRNA interferase YafQ